MHAFRPVAFAAAVAIPFALPAVLSTPVAADEVKATGEIAGIGVFQAPEKVAGELQFTEGPTPDAEGNLYFTDIPADRIYKLAADGKLEIFLQPAGHANGLMIDGGNRLFACQMDGKVVRIDLETRKLETVADQHDGKPFNAPNDVVVDSTGGIYFTDPRFRAAMPLPQGTEGVYYVAADGKVTRLHESDVAPNGVILSPDEKTLYVVPSMSKTMLAFDVEAPGKVGPPRKFCDLAQPENAERDSGGDGLTIDSKGNLYITTNLGIQIFSAEGKALGIVALPEQPANCAFGGKDLDVLYATSRTSVYRIPIGDAQVTGHRFPGKGD